MSEHITRKISSDLSLEGFTLISGLARGIDRSVHEAALQGNCPTVAVLANGIDIKYPVANSDIYDKILLSENSALISEYPPKIRAGKWTFVRRNRIISGLSSGVVVVKAAEKSGALITAKYAAEQNREVFVCPGYSFNAEYAGCHKLIKEGAVLVRNTQDILNEISYQRPLVKKNAVQPELKIEKALIEQDEQNEDTILEPEQKKIAVKLREGINQIDLLANELNTPISKIREIVMLMELDGLVNKNGNILELQI
jgi:DNA processing protein